MDQISLNFCPLISLCDKAPNKKACVLKSYIFNGIIIFWEIAALFKETFGTKTVRNDEGFVHFTN